MKKLFAAVALLALLAGGAPAWATAIDSNTKLLLQGNTTTAGGNVKAIFLDGSSDYLTVADHADLDFGTGDYTVEGWFKFRSNGVGHGLISRNDGSGAGGYMLEWSSSSGGQLIWSGNTATLKAATLAITNYKWYHFAAVRSGTNVYLFINGVLQGSAGTSSTNISGTDALYIGRFSSGIRDFDGWMKNVRLSNTARYTADFVPSTDNFSDDANTKLLLIGEESLHATTFTDSEGTPKTVTTNGDAVNQLTSDFRESIITDTEGTPKYPITQYGDVKIVPYKQTNTAAFFDGASTVSVPDSTDWDMGTGDFTIEGWFNWQTVQDGVMVDMGSAVSGTAKGVWLRATGTAIESYVNSTQHINYSFVPAANTWYHVALSRSGTGSNLYKLFINGKNVASATSSDNITGSTEGVTIGKASVWASGYFLGWMKEVRISNSARYTADFTPTDTPFTSDSNTKLLIHGNTSATSPIAPAIKFDGTGDYLTIPDAAWQDFGTGAWTVEGFARWSTVGGATLMTIGTSATGIRMAIRDTGGTAGFHTYVVNTEYQSTGFTPVNERWYHFAAVRDGNDLEMFVDGVSYGSTDITGKDITGLTAGVTFGGDSGGAALLDGWARNLRISNVARYTAAFTPPTGAFTSDANTMFLLNGNVANGTTSFTDASSNGATITRNGDVVGRFVEDYQNTIFTDSGNTGHKAYPAVGGRAKIDFLTAFGYGAITMDGTLDHLTLADSSDWQLGGGTGKFTYDLWVRPTAFGNTQMLYAQGTDGSTYTDFRIASATELRFGADTTIFSYGAPLTGNPKMVANNWYHVALIRGWGGVTNDYAITVNGTAIATGTDADTFPDYAGLLGIGNLQYASTDQGSTYYFQGRMDNARISDIARWTATFDPETSDFGGTRRRSAVFF